MGRPARSELFIPIAVGTVIRARYVGPGGGSLNIHRGGDIVLHVNPRPHEGLVLNSHFGGWGPEERPDDYPFEPGVDIALAVRLKSNGFLITALASGSDGFEYLYAYRHPAGAALDRLTLDIPGLRGFQVQPKA